MSATGGADTPFELVRRVLADMSIEKLSELLELDSQAPLLDSLIIEQLERQIPELTTALERWEHSDADITQRQATLAFLARTAPA